MRQPLTVTNTSDRALYQVLTARGSPEHYSPQPDNVLKIERSYFSLDGNPAELDQLASGDLVLVRLQLSASEAVRDALVVDLLPAGFELENQSLGQSSVLLDEVASFSAWQKQWRKLQSPPSHSLTTVMLPQSRSAHGAPLHCCIVRAVTPGNTAAAGTGAIHVPADRHAQHRGEITVVNID